MHPNISDPDPTWGKHPRRSLTSIICAGAVGWAWRNGRIARSGTPEQAGLFCIHASVSFRCIERPRKAILDAGAALLSVYSQRPSEDPMSLLHLLICQDPAPFFD
jgi:hypothetical protein